MMKIFATVGTTSFDDFVQSICSLPFLTVMAQVVNEFNETSVTSRIIDSINEPRTALRHGLVDTDHVEMVIQYGQGKCPNHFLASNFDNIRFNTHMETNNEDDSYHEGSTSVSLPIQAKKDGTKVHCQNTNLSIKWYRFKPSLLPDMKQANIILTHAGAGTLLEALYTTSRAATVTKNNNQRNVPTIINAVINSTLMNNHQSELAEELEKRKYILVTRDCTLLATYHGAEKFWRQMRNFVPISFVGGHAINSVGQADKVCQVSSFQRIVDHVKEISYIDDEQDCDQFNKKAE